MCCMKLFLNAVKVITKPPIITSDLQFLTTKSGSYQYSVYLVFREINRTQFHLNFITYTPL